MFVSELAHKDLDSIVAYIALELANPAAAGDLLDEVSACYRNLKNNPMLYAKCRDKRLEAEGYRKALIKSYVAVYKVNEDTKSSAFCAFSMVHRTI